MGYTFRYFDTNKMEDVSEAARANFAFVPNTGNIYDVREQVYAGFLMGNAKFDWGSAVGGVRVEHITNRGIAVATVAGVTGPVTAESSQTLVFPSMHINYNVDDTKKLRLSFNSGAARADYDQLRPNVTVNDSNQTISGGNPAVKPERAYGVDAYWEWYVQPQGFVSLGVFYKKVDDVLFDDVRVFSSNVLNSGGVDRSGYRLSTKVNGGEGYIAGIEGALQFQLEPYTEQLGLPAWIGGFGINTNVTLNESEAETPGNTKVTLPNTSDLVYNIGLYYEKYGLSARVNYRERSEWLDVYGPEIDGGSVYWATDDEMDASVRYAVSDNLEVYFDASNLTNTPGRRYSRESQYTIEWERFGRRFDAGVRFTF
jgi:TonB-dependent receptor